MAGGRFSYTGLVLAVIVPDVTLNYWDYQARARLDIGARDRVELLVFGSGDYLSNKETSYESTPASNGASTMTKRENTLVDVGFHRFDLRFDHRLSQGNWRNALTLGLDRTGFDDGNIDVTNRLVGARSEYQQRLSDGPELRAGADVLFESLAQKVRRNGSSSGDVASTSGTTVDNTASWNALGSAPQDVVTSSSNSNDQLAEGFDRARKDLTAGVWGDFVIDVAPRVQITPGVRVDSAVPRRCSKTYSSI
jgi:hypothetical protein